MDRLTERDEFGNADIIGVDSQELTESLDFDQLNRVTEALNRLAAYEDTDFTPADIKDMRNELCLKCGDYKNAHKGACDGCRWRKCYE